VTALLVALGGALGAATRYVVERAVSGRRGEPWGTFVVNVSGSFLLGLLLGLRRGDTVTTVLGAGVLGSYTTFSAYAVQVVRGARRYAVLSVLAGVAAGGLGIGIGLLLE